MKKSARWIPITITAVFAAILVGVFIYRQLNPTTVSLSSDNTTVINDNKVPILDGKLNINAASVEELILLPGIGEGLAENIINYRSENGAFAHPEDLKNVAGIGDVRYNAISDYITVGQHPPK